MGVRPGFKLTEVGVIPEDWRIQTLGELKVLMTNGFVGPVKQHYAENEDGVLYIQGYNVQENAFNFHGIKFVTEAFHRAHLKSCLQAGDLLTVQTGDVGLTTIVPEYLAGSNCHALIITRFDLRRACPSFISFYLNSDPGRSRLRLIETGTTMKHLNVGDMLQFWVPLPPTKAEQEAIAEALSDADALVESLEQLLAKKRHLKHGAMQELLTGKVRLRAFQRAERSFRETPFGQVPADWIPTLLESISDSITKGSTPTTYGFDWQSDGILFLRSECVSQRGLELSQSMFISEEAHRSIHRSKVSGGDLLMTITGNVGRVVWLRNDFGEANINQHIARIRIVSGQVAAAFIFHFLSQPLVRRYYNLITTGQAYPQISLRQVRETEIPLPSLDEQTAIAAVLTDMDAEIAALETKLAKARQLKQGMMQELLTGRIRLV